GVLARELEVPREAEGGDAVEDPEVEQLCNIACVLRERGRSLAEHLGGRARMDVLPAREGLAQLRRPGDMREDAQLDLRVVGRDEAKAGLGDERTSDFAAELGADRD